MINFLNKLYIKKMQYDTVYPNLDEDIYSNLKVRSSGLELFRIIVMFLIVAHHYVVNSGLMSYIANSNYDFSLNNIFRMVDHPSQAVLQSRNICQ